MGGKGCRKVCVLERKRGGLFISFAYDTCSRSIEYSVQFEPRCLKPCNKCLMASSFPRVDFQMFERADARGRGFGGVQRRKKASALVIRR